jgi:hypothetical protein
MSRILRAAIVLAPCLAAAPSFAGALPRYGVAFRCREVANFSGGWNRLHYSCIDMKQQTYNG